MATKLLHKRGTSNPSASDLDVGEIGINTTDGGIFTKTSGGSVVEAGGGGSANGLTLTSHNTFGGTNAGANLGSGNYNTGIGKQALYDLDNGDRNTSLGYDSLYNVVSGTNNVGVGDNAGFAYTGSSGTFVGSGAFKNGTGSQNVAVGYRAIGGTCTGNNNVAVGVDAGIGMSSATNNVAVGAHSLYSNSTADYNTAVGSQALYAATTGNKNVAVGYQALHTITDKNGNTAVGYEAGKPHTGANNTLIGYQAGAVANSGDNNIVIGKEAYTSTTSVSNEITLGNGNHTKFRVPGTDLESSAGVLDIKNSGTASEMRLYCESSNAHYAAIKSPAHSAFSGNLTFTLPGGYGTNAQVLTSDGSGGMSWTTPATGGGTYTAGTGLNLSSNAFSLAYGNSSSNAVRKITSSTAAPSGGSDGDIWIKYT